MEDITAAARAFSKQSSHFDEEDLSNPILQAWRKQVYAHVGQFIKPKSKILELNAGTGIDAVYFAGQGHRVHATDISSGMIRRIEEKINRDPDQPITCQQVAYDKINEISEGKFDLVFSNFGGLNCEADLSRVTRHLPALLTNGAYVSWVIMPPQCPWEWLWLARGKWREATRRSRKSGSVAHLEGEFFQTYYHPLSAIQNALGESFQLVRSESLGLIKPPPSATAFQSRHPRLSNWLERGDRVLKDVFPFNRWGDHIIVTFTFNGQ